MGIDRMVELLLEQSPWKGKGKDKSHMATISA